MIDSPEDENTLIVQGDFARVRAQITENHILHMQKHMELLQSPSLASLPPHLLQQITEFTQQHIQEHQFMMQQMMAIMQKVGGGSGKGLEDTGSSGDGRPSSMGTIPGPLGTAMQDQRSGEVGSNSGE